MQCSRNLFILLLLGLSFGLSGAEEIQRPIKVFGDEPVRGQGTATITDLKDGRYEITIDDLIIIGKPDIKPQLITEFRVGLLGPRRRNAREGAVLGEIIPQEVTIWAGDRYAPGHLSGVVEGEQRVTLDEYTVCVSMERMQVDDDKRRTVWIHYDNVEIPVETPAEVTALNENEDKVIDFVLAPFLKHKQRYLDGLEILERRYESASDQAGLQAVTREIETIEKTGRPTDVRGYPDLERGQDFFIKGRDEIGAEMFPKLEKWVKEHHSRAEALEATLRLEGKTEAAVAVLEEKTRLGRMITYPKTIPAEMGVAFLSKGSFADYDPDVVAPPFLEPEWLEDRTIGPALVNGGGNLVTIGAPGEGGTGPDVKLIPKTELSNAEILTRNGTLTIEKGHLNNCQLLTQVGRFNVNRSLFVESTIGIDAQSLGEPRSVKFEFHNCRFDQGSFENLSIADTQLKATKCNFTEIKFPSLRYLEGGGEQIGTEEFLFENCSFFRCEIPISLLLMTKNCVFGDCRFVDDSDLATDPRQIDVSVFITGKRPTPPTCKTERFTFTLIPSRPVSATADMEIGINDGRIEIYKY